MGWLSWVFGVLYMHDRRTNQCALHVRSCLDGLFLSRASVFWCFVNFWRGVKTRRTRGSSMAMFHLLITTVSARLGCVGPQFPSVSKNVPKSVPKSVPKKVRSFEEQPSCASSAGRSVKSATPCTPIISVSSTWQRYKTGSAP